MAGGDQNGLNQRTATYGANTLNQYTNRTVPGFADIMGLSLATNTVTVSGQTAYRKAEYFRDQLPVANSSAAAWTNIVVAATGQNSVTGNVYLAQTPETYGYDPDGNLTSDGRWTYSWDSENRLISMQGLSGIPTGAKLKIDFAYDYQGRRIQKMVSTNNGSAYFAQSTNRFLYDGWNLLAILNAQTLVQQSFVWGLAVSANQDGGGGVAGLLEVSDLTNGTFFATCDGNGNVTLLVKATDGTISADYEYGPFGEVLRTTGQMAKPNPFRFSTKYQDDETDLLYYGYRFYNSNTGRWLNRDLIEESGGFTLYASGGNNLVSNVDPLGLWYHDFWSGGWGVYKGTAVAGCGDTLEDLADLITGDRSDSRLLQVSGPVSPNQVVDISPLLVAFEDRLRLNVKNATTLNFGPRFGPVSVPGFFSEGSDGVNGFFNSRGTTATLDCAAAAQIMLAKGLLDTIGARDFNGIRLQYNTVPLLHLPNPSIAKLKIGDIAYLANYSDYLTAGSPSTTPRLWAGENVIKYDDEHYWGFGGGGLRTLDDWYSVLKGSYTTDTGVSRTDPIPGFQDAEFIDVAQVATKRFEFRRSAQ